MLTLRVTVLALFCPFAFSLQAAAVQNPTDAARAETLRAIDMEKALALESAARRKTAIVLQGQSVNPVATDDEIINVIISGPPGSHLGAAMAAAIDRRGYFLTAAHVAADEPLSLVFFDGARLRALPARVVAKLSNNHKQSKLDIAVLHVSAELSEVFQWADLSKVHRSDRLLEIGRAAIHDQSKAGGIVTKGIVAPAAFVGKFRKTINLRSGGTAIRSEIPARHGDSGGPLLTLEGKLLGVECGFTKPLLRRGYEVANRPDLKWLTDIINADTNNDILRHSQLTTAEQNRDSGDPITITVPLLH
jgi:S1-C subfamily serine protease